MNKTNNKKHAFYLVFFFTYAFIGLFIILGFKGEYNEPFYFAFKLLSVPFALICYYVLKWEYKNNKIKPLGVFYALFCFCVLVGYGGGYLVIINNNFGVQQQVQVTGKVLSKRSSSGKYKHNYYVTVRSEAGKVIEFEVENHQYNKYRKNQAYNSNWQIGSLGLWYR